MKNKIYLFVSFLLTINLVFSAPIDEATVKKAAKNFFERNTVLRSASPVSINIFHIEKDENTVYYYNVTDENSGSWIILSADDQITPILAYSTVANWGETVNPAFQMFLDAYKASIAEKLANNQPELRSSTKNKAKEQWEELLNGNILRSNTSTTETPIVDMLLKTSYPREEPIEWSQSINVRDETTPVYNGLCPYDQTTKKNALTGCVATAMGMLIKYWGDKTADGNIHGQNSFFYTHPTFGKQFVDYSLQNYNTRIMPGNPWTYSDFTLDGSPPRSFYTSTPTQINEVSKLLYHCGVAARMNYGVNGSGAFTTYAGGALSSFFGFQNTTFLEKKNFTNILWNEILKNEILERRPVFYGATTDNNEGHAFVLDGYNTIGGVEYFHVNWGWGPFGENTWLTLDGIAGHYPNNQVAFINIQPQNKNNPQVRILDVNISGKNTTNRLLGDYVAITGTQLYPTELTVYNPSDEDINCSFITAQHIAVWDYSNNYVNIQYPVITIPAKQVIQITQSSSSLSLLSGYYPAGSDFVTTVDLNSESGNRSVIRLNNSVSVLASAPATASITQQPKSMTVSAGEPAVFKINARGNGISYQWKKNGEVLEGKTKNPLVIHPTAVMDEGIYSCTVTASSNVVTSETASLTVTGSTGIYHTTGKENPFEVAVQSGLLLVSTKAAKAGSYEVADISGKQIASGTLQNGQTSLYITQPGIYLLKLCVEGENYVQKVIVRK